MKYSIVHYKIIPSITVLSGLLVSADLVLIVFAMPLISVLPEDNKVSLHCAVQFSAVQCSAAQRSAV